MKIQCFHNTQKIHKKHYGIHRSAMVNINRVIHMRVDGWGGLKTPCEASFQVNTGKKIRKSGMNSV